VHNFPKNLRELKELVSLRADFLSNGYSLLTQVWIPQKLLEIFSGLAIPFRMCEGYLKYLKMGFGFALHHQIA